MKRRRRLSVNQRSVLVKIERGDWEVIHDLSARGGFFARAKGGGLIRITTGTIVVLCSFGCIAERDGEGTSWGTRLYLTEKGRKAIADDGWIEINEETDRA